MMVIDKLKKRIINDINKTLISSKPGLFRPSSYPYLTGDSLRNFSDHIFDETTSFDPASVKNNEIIFLKTDLKNIFFENYHPLIFSNYKLITHNSDFSIEEEDLRFIDEKVVHWFAAKLNVRSSEKISAIPYGLENKRYLNNGIVKNFKSVSERTKNVTKLDKILCSFNPSTNPIHREPLIELSQKRVDLINIKNFDNNREYLSELSKYKFNLCPEGNNFESHRIWESLIFRCTPIVEKNTVNSNFVELGIPLIVLDKFDDLHDLEYEDLVKMNKENEKKDYEIFTSLNYWCEVINSKI